eukprot:NODE_70_length_24940_cov_0.663138.p12 type:complete len:310 gc:universal NODE_70_length_24940_cov_0.663138:11195-10266(-)
MKWTANDIPDLNGKVAIVTGANSGIGYHTALELARKNAKVYLACRNEEKAKAAIEEMQKQVSKANLVFGQLDLSDLSSVQKFADFIKKNETKIDILVNNAGLSTTPKLTKTKDGFEMQMGTNHLGHFALTGHLLKLLKNARIVNVSSNAIRLGPNIDFDNMDYAKGGYKPFTAYANSKLANIWFSLMLQQKSKNANLNMTVTSSHPGLTSTNIPYNPNGPAVKSGSFMDYMVKCFNYLFAQTADKGALPSLYAATSDKVSPNGFYGPDTFFEMWGSPKQCELNALAKNEELAHKLWEWSEKMTIKYDFK